jgi:hypothetical protein
MFKEKAPKKEDVAINMVLAITTIVKYSKMWCSKRKNFTRTKVWLIGKRRKIFNFCLKKLLKTCNRRNLRGIYLEPIYKILLKPTSWGILVQVPKSKLLEPQELPLLPKILLLLDLLEHFLFWKK